MSDPEPTNEVVSRNTSDPLADSSKIVRRVPAGAQLARRTPTWTRESVPKALLSDHQTSVWAELVVSAGTVRFIERDTDYSTIVTAEQPVAIVPHRAHRIEPDDVASFHVAFYSLSGDDPA